MPVSTAIRGGMWAFGLTSVWNSPSTSPPRTLTAPTSVIMSVSAPPVVSRSTTQNVTSDRCVPRSSNEACSATMATLGMASDTDERLADAQPGVDGLPFTACLGSKPTFTLDADGSAHVATHADRQQVR